MDQPVRRDARRRQRAAAGEERVDGGEARRRDLALGVVRGLRVGRVGVAYRLDVLIDAGRVDGGGGGLAGAALEIVESDGG